MPSITAPSDFNSGVFRIPNAVSGNVGEATNDDLLDVIAKAERALLLRALGSTQYDAFMTALGEDPIPSPWLGLRNVIKPILIRFVYCEWLQFDEVNYTTVGGGKGQASGQTIADLSAKFVKAWNEMVDLYSGYQDFEVSLYEYLQDTDGLSEEHFQFSYKYVNQLGL